jgi:hypothetical protein
MINAVVRSTVMSVMMYISFPRQLSLDNDYHGIQLVLIHIFLKKVPIIKAKYKILLSLHWTPLLEPLSVLLPNGT